MVNLDKSPEVDEWFSKSGSRINFVHSRPIQMLQLVDEVVVRGKRSRF